MELYTQDIKAKQETVRQLLRSIENLPGDIEPMIVGVHLKTKPLEIE